MQREANQNEISLNVLVNQTLKKYTEWGRYENKIGMIPIPKLMLSSLIDRAIEIAKKTGILNDSNIDPYRDQVIKEAANTAYDLMQDAVLFMRKGRFLALCTGDFGAVGIIGILIDEAVTLTRLVTKNLNVTAL